MNSKYTQILKKIYQLRRVKYTQNCKDFGMKKWMYNTYNFYMDTYWNNIFTIGLIKMYIKLISSVSFFYFNVASKI